MGDNEPEPWLRGPLAGVHPLLAPVFYSFVMAREDLAKYTAGLTRTAIWTDVDGPSLGFHLKHIAGSVDRLTAYLLETELSAGQLAALKAEAIGDDDVETLLRLIDASLSNCEKRIAALDPASIYEVRVVGRQALPSTVIGLIVHLCEHTQRHVGQAITLAKHLRARADV